MIQWYSLSLARCAGRITGYNRTFSTQNCLPRAAKPARPKFHGTTEHDRQNPLGSEGRVGVMGGPQASSHVVREQNQQQCLGTCVREGHRVLCAAVTRWAPALPQVFARGRWVCSQPWTDWLNFATRQGRLDSNLCLRQEEEPSSSPWNVLRWQMQCPEAGERERGKKQVPGKANHAK